MQSFNLSQEELKSGTIDLIIKNNLNKKLIVGKSIYNLRFPSIEYLCYFFIQLLYCAIVLLMFGLLLSLIIPEIKALMPVGMTIMFIPVKYLANDFYYIWIGQVKWNVSFVKCNTIWLILLCLICYIIYRGKNNVTKTFNQ